MTYAVIFHSKAIPPSLYPPFKVRVFTESFNNTGHQQIYCLACYKHVGIDWVTTNVPKQYLTICLIRSIEVYLMTKHWRRKESRRKEALKLQRYLL